MTSLTVSMPYYGTAGQVRRAVESVLAQTFTDLVLVVVNDGGPPEVWEPLADIDDPRLVRFDLAENHGRYYADAVTLAAAQTEWWGPVDSDDWLDPDRFEQMFAVGGEVKVSGEVVHGLHRTHDLDPDLKPPTPEKMRHLWHSSQLYRRDAVKGLIHPGFRVGYDTLFSNLVALSCDVAAVAGHSYHRVARRDSLTRSPETGFGSEHRKAATARLNGLYERALRNPDRNGLRALIATDVPREVVAAAQADADRLAGLLDQDFAPPAPEPIDAADVCVTLLCGERPDLLARTLESTRRVHPGLLESARLVVLHNGGDAATAAVLDEHAEVIDRRDVWDTMAPIGVAVAHLAKAAKASRRPFWLHLEDDWQALADPGWLDRARSILDQEPEIAQVKVRADADRVLAKHMVTGKKMVWHDADGCRVTDDSHYTTNPGLIRVKDAGDAWPADGEKHAQRRWHEAGHHGAAQLVPGAFTHIGDGRSLREQTGCPA